MTYNVGGIDRSLRFILGVLLLTWAIAGGPSGPLSVCFSFSPAHLASALSIGFYV